ncbi:MAG: NAD-dependent epimerase/dehydratase family protein [Candidatus Kapabacteria bacterium]|nr:NAD-dependent epimerase/dehydratase family protein [Candidatus Kapabacteria bacterium]
MPRTILVTGANGEIGHTLLERFAELEGARIITVDLAPLHADLASKSSLHLTGDVSDPALWARLQEEDINEIHHLAALLSTSAEKAPERAHHVNVNGTLGLLSMARAIGQRRGSPVTFLFPSTIAVFGLPNLETKQAAGRLTEDQYLQPITMYGINKLYCEQLGGYMSDRYGQLLDAQADVLDFRALRFPGLISAHTVPSGGTSDFAPEMIHNAAQGKSYACFVRPDARIPFMAMPDGVEALLKLASADRSRLRQRVYNIGAFAPSAEAIAAEVRSVWPNTDITYAPHPKRQAIIDSWCADVDDSAARADWDWAPAYDQRRAFDDYLIPIISERYSS